MRIKNRRTMLGMTQEELSEAMGVPKSTISAYENDKVDIKASVIMELAGKLFTSPNYLLGFENEKDADDQDPLLQTMETILRGIKDEKARQFLWVQLKAMGSIYSAG